MSMEDYSFAVCTRCITYNQINYIPNTLKGFVIQEFKYPVVYTIVDDASTDGEQDYLVEWAKNNLCYDNKDAEVLKETPYGRMIYGRLLCKDNVFFAIILLKENHYSRNWDKYQYIERWDKRAKYIAFCEGDDYWTDPQKLQKQFFILEENQDASFVYSSFQTVDDKSRAITLDRCEEYINRSHSGLVFFDLLVNDNFILTVTTFFRNECLKDRFPMYYDYGTFLQSARKGKAIFMPEKTSCYRIHSMSITHVANESLYPLRAFILFNEVKECMKGNACKEVIMHPLFLKTIGFVIGFHLQRRYSPYRWRYLNLLVIHPILIIPTIRGFIMEFFNTPGKNQLLNELSKL